MFAALQATKLPRTNEEQKDLFCLQCSVSFLVCFTTTLFFFTQFHSFFGAVQDFDAKRYIFGNRKLRLIRALKLTGNYYEIPIRRRR